MYTCEFLGFHSSVAEVSILLWYDTISLSNLFPTFRDNMVVSSSGVEMSNVFVNNRWTVQDDTWHFNRWRWDHYIVFKCWQPITQWSSITSQKNRYITLYPYHSILFSMQFSLTTATVTEKLLEDPQELWHHHKNHNYWDQNCRFLQSARAFGA